MDHFRRQYLLTGGSSPTWLPDSFVHHGTIANYTIHASETLPVSVDQKRETAVAVLGDIFDPTEPQASNDDIVETLASCGDREIFLKQLQGYSGRYIAVRDGNNGAAVVPDAGGLRRVLFTDGVEAITSSPKLFLEAFDLDHEMSTTVAEFVDSGRLQDNDYAWPGTQTIDRRLTSLLPNRYLDLDASTPRRRPLYSSEVPDQQSPIDVIMDTLSGGLAAIHNRYKVRFPLTAGWDSRLLLAAADGIDDDAEFFTFATNVPPSHPDVSIPYRLAETLDLSYEAIRVPELRDSFVERMHNDYINPRLANKTRNIQYHYENATEGTVVLTGNVAEIIRAYYDAPHDVTPSLLSELYHYPHSDFARTEFSRWLDDARPYAEQTGIELLDLFYWEQRIGNWGARWPYEQDIAIPEFSPFNHYNLLLCGLSTPRRKREPANSTFFEKAVSSSRPTLSSIPINPPASNRERLKKSLKNTARKNKMFYRLKTIFAN